MQQTVSYKIKPIPKQDFGQVVDLWNLAFGSPDSPPQPEWHDYALEFCEKGHEYMVGAYEGSSLAATSSVIDFPMHVGNRWVTCGGIAGVATHPQHRRQKLVNKLLADCLQHLHKRRVPISALWPFNYDFYGAMGWSVTDHRYEIKTSVAALNTVNGRARAYDSIALTDHAYAKELHFRWIQTHNLSMERSHFRWKNLLSGWGNANRLYVHQDGYMVWNMTASKDRILRIAEWCYLTDQAFLDGLKLIAQMDSQFDQVVWIGAETDTLYRLVGPSKLHHIEQQPGMMSRVVHLEAFLEDLGAPDGLQISDPLAVTAPKLETDEPGPGALVQHVSGFWRAPNPKLPKSLYKVAGQYPAFSAERY
jgi:predicted acetyltransferase